MQWSAALLDLVDEGIIELEDLPIEDVNDGPWPGDDDLEEDAPEE